MKPTLRIEKDKGITKLLKKHPKYRLEYDLNVYAQGYEYLRLILFSGAIFSIGIAQKCLEVAAKGLRSAKLI